RKTAQIVHDLQISQCVVERILKMWCETGEVVPQGPGRHAEKMTLLLPEETKVSSIWYILMSLVERFPNIYLDEIQKHLLLKHEVVVGLSTIWKMLTHLGLSHNKVSRHTKLWCMYVKILI
ncbi:hypothetical protein K439DRAFT_1336824, partial [Ramaria rubella]